MICSKCGRDLPEDQFRYRQCKECTAAVGRACELRRKVGQGPQWLKREALQWAGLDNGATCCQIGDISPCGDGYLARCWIDGEQFESRTSRDCVRWLEQKYAERDSDDLRWLRDQLPIDESESPAIHGSYV